MNKLIECFCGCKTQIPSQDKHGNRKRYAYGHFTNKIKINNEKIQCQCGCGTLLSKYDDYGRPRKYITGHNTVKKYEDPTQYKREWNHKNRESRQKNKRKHLTLKKFQIYNLMGNKCLDCGIKVSIENRNIFHIHHLPNVEKKFNVAKAIGNVSFSTILEEIKKCILLCSNCHSKRHTIDILDEEILEEIKHFLLE